jgi:hypothetical protein
LRGPPQPDDEPTPLQTKTYRFSVTGTRPVLQIDLSSGEGDAKSGPQKLTIELHTPMSGEIFEAKTSNGRLEVDSDGRVMYFCQAPDSVSFTLFLGRSVVVSMSRKDGEVTVQSPSKMLSVEKSRSKPSGLGNSPSNDSVKIRLE